MNITKILASIPIFKVFTGAKAPAESSGVNMPKSSASPIKDKLDISSAALGVEVLSDAEAQGAAENLGRYFAENDDALGGDANKIAQL
tara:strand:- start:32914 stop:33177 length:264 start_codon:yes stop_codon:yes gene_type:complete